MGGGRGVGGNFKLIDALGYGQSLLKSSKIEQPGHYKYIINSLTL